MGGIKRLPLVLNLQVAVLSIISLFFLPLILYLMKRDPNLQEDRAETPSDSDEEKDIEKDSKEDATVTVTPVI